ncbi:MAG TPA: hypothetical protein VGP06_09415 [Janthinobacterium sp.]|jgi:hypothetical protein|nr:hypothetical protein [Janthinobacterium sp.]
MPKNKRPVPRKTATPEDKDEAITQTLADLALALAEQEDGDTLNEELRRKEADFHKLVRKSLNQKKDEVLYEAIERARDEDLGAWQFLRGAVEEAAATVLLRREGAPEMEINAFLIPLFVRGTGGLKEEQGFQDQAAFEALLASFQEGQLESAKARVVLIRHAYDLAEIDSIAYSHLNEMVREAATSMTDKKIAAAPALERSIAGWSATAFGAGDEVSELRFLLGFALKRADDPFYAVPENEDAADAYFETRMQRYREWTIAAAPLLKSCLAPPATALELHFLYQDLFYGAKEQAMAEYAMLQLMAALNDALREKRLDAQQVKAIVAPAAVRGAMVLRVNLYPAAGGAPLASAEKPLDLAADLEAEVDDVCDALATIGLHALSVALRFDADGQPLEERAYVRP